MAPKKPKNPPTLLLIQQNFLRLQKIQLMLPTTVISMTVAGLFLYWAMGMGWITGSFTVLILTLTMLWFRWSLVSRKLADANRFLPRYVLEDERDLQWLAWFAYVEPRALRFLNDVKPDARYTSRDFLSVYVAKTQDENDAAFRAPYFGDSEARFLDLDIRRAKERTVVLETTRIS